MTTAAPRVPMDSTRKTALIAGIWLWQHPPRVPVTPWRRLRSIPAEWVLVLLVVAAVGTMMIWTFHYDEGTLWIAGALWRTRKNSLPNSG